MSKRKDKGIASGILKLTYVIVILTILFVCLFLHNMLRVKQYLFPNAVNILLGICVYAAVCLIAYLIFKRISYKGTKRIILLLSILSVFYLFLVSLHYCFSTSWDCSTILENARYLAHDMTDSVNIKYYSNYPNNILLTFLYSLLYRLADIFGISQPYFLILFVQCVIYSASGYLIYKAADMHFSGDGRMYSAAVWIIYMMLIGGSPWIVIPYSDSVGLIFVTSCVLCYFKFKKGRHTILYLALLTILSVFGYFIKPQIFIFAIALIVVETAGMVKKLFKSPLTFIKNGTVILLSAVLALCAMSAIRTACSFNIEKEERLGIAHFIMMGLNSERYGGFNPDDVLYSQSYHTNKERDAADISKAEERVDKLGFSGMRDLAIYKTLINYNDGTFAWWIEGSFFMQKYTHINNSFEDFICRYYYRGGKYYVWFNTVMQIIWLGTMFFMIFASRVHDKKIYTLMLSVIGLTLFVFIFEARARYLFAYVPMYILLAVIGLRGLLSFPASLRKKSHKSSVSDTETERKPEEQTKREKIAS